jgi:hypothetical protein
VDFDSLWHPVVLLDVRLKSAVVAPDERAAMMPRLWIPLIDRLSVPDLYTSG